jgi:hypothetical protein
VNKVIGPLPDGEIENRGRFDTVGRTVYFGDTKEVCFAETLQDFRLNRQALVADAQSAGQDVDEFIRDVTNDAIAADRDTPWAVGGAALEIVKQYVANQRNV